MDPRLEAGLPTWSQLAHQVELKHSEPVLVALSGGADSVWLLHCLAQSEARESVIAAHVDHGLRGDESAADRRFCAQLCSELRIPFHELEVKLDPDATDLERRAREARYRGLARIALQEGRSILLTAHHGDDALETLLMRWTRGTSLYGLAGLRHRAPLPVRVEGAQDLTLVRPLLDLRAADLRADLQRAGHAWREDSSNCSRRFTRNRVRHGLLPWLEQHAGQEAGSQLRAFHDSIQLFAKALDGAGQKPIWREGEGGRHSLSTGALRTLPELVRSRILWQLLVEATGQAPRGPVLERIVSCLGSGQTNRWTLKGAWDLCLTRDSLELVQTKPRPKSGPTAVPGAPER